MRAALHFGHRLQRFWIGAAAGQSRYEAHAATHLADSAGVDEISVGYKVFAGYRLHRYIGAEASYVNLGKMEYAGSSGGVPVTDGRLEVKGATFSLLGFVPLLDELTLFGRAGLFLWQAEASDTSPGGSFSSKTTGRKGAYGLGAIYSATRVLGVRGEVEDYRYGTFHVRLWSLGASFNF